MIKKNTSRTSNMLFVPVYDPNQPNGGIYREYFMYGNNLNMAGVIHQTDQLVTKKLFAGFATR